MLQSKAKCFQKVFKKTKDQDISSTLIVHRCVFFMYRNTFKSFIIPLLMHMHA